MLTKLDAKDPEALSRFLRETTPDAANASIRKAVFLAWWLLPTDERTDENLEREIRRLLDGALNDFRADREAFLNQPGGTK